MIESITHTVTINPFEIVYKAPYKIASHVSSIPISSKQAIKILRTFFALGLVVGDGREETTNTRTKQ